MEQFYSSQTDTFTSAHFNVQNIRMFDDVENDPHSSLFPSDRQRATSILMKLDHDDIRKLLQLRIKACKWLNRREIVRFVRRIVDIRFSKKKKFNQFQDDFEMTNDMKNFLMSQISILEITEILKIYKKAKNEETLLDDIQKTVSYKFQRYSLRQFEFSQRMPVTNHWVVKDNVEFNSPCAAM